jgi:hypothetical protein
LVKRRDHTANRYPGASKNINEDYGASAANLNG